MMIPQQLQRPEFRFVLLKSKTKIPFEKDWQKDGYDFEDPKLLEHIKKGSNFGVIGGYGNLRMIDCDNKEFADEMKKKLDTFSVKTGSGGRHFYILTDYDVNHVFIDEKGEYRANNYQVVAPGCIHPNGNKYEITDDKAIAEMSKEEVEDLLKPYLRGEMSQQLVPNNSSDTSRSATEYRHVCSLISKGKSKEEVYREMQAFSKWVGASEQYRELTYQKALSFVEGQKSNDEGELIMTEQIQKMLKQEDMLELVNNEFDKKIVREIEARKVIFLVANMRNVANLNPGSDNLIVNAISGTGKDHVTESVFDIIPENEKEELKRITPKVLAYNRNRSLDSSATYKKTALRMEDVSKEVVNDDSLKVFLTASSDKLNHGKTMIKQKVVDIIIDGKPSIIMTIANPDIRDEQLRRLPVLFLDEGVDQTKEILKRQAQYAIDGIVAEYDSDIKQSLRFLKRVVVKIPFSHQLIPIFEKSSENVIARTAFPRFMDYIKTSASLYQFQRSVDEQGKVIATEQDLKNACLCLRKTTSNLLMVPLSKLDQKLHAFFKDNQVVGLSIDDIMDNEAIQSLGKSDRWIKYRLDFLVSKKFLKRSSEKREGSFKPFVTYSYREVGEFEIPDLESLGFTSNTSKGSKASNSSFSSNTNNNFKYPKKVQIHGVNEVNEVNEVFATVLTKQKKKKNGNLSLIAKHISQLDKGQGVHIDALLQSMKEHKRQFDEYLNYSKMIGEVIEIRPMVLKINT